MWRYCRTVETVTIRRRFLQSKEKGKRMIDARQIDEIVQNILADLNGNKHIDRMNVYNRLDKAEVHRLLQHLFQIVFPGYFRDGKVKIYNPQNSMAVTLEDIFYHLNKLVTLTLDFGEGVGSEEEKKEKGYEICKEFMEAIPTIRSMVETDLLAIFYGDPAAGCVEEVILAYPGIMAITAYRLAHQLYRLGVPVIPRLMTEYAHAQTGIDIHPGATIGSYFFIDHGTGVVIGETAVIGQHVKIYQGVTIGALSTRGGRQLYGRKRHPTIGDYVTVYAGASILGGDTVIGNHSIIGSNTFLTTSVPENSRVVVENRVAEKCLLEC